MKLDEKISPEIKHLKQGVLDVLENEKEFSKITKNISSSQREKVKNILTENLSVLLNPVTALGGLALAFGPVAFVSGFAALNLSMILGKKIKGKKTEITSEEESNHHSLLNNKEYVKNLLEGSANILDIGGTGQLADFLDKEDNGKKYTVLNIDEKLINTLNKDKENGKYSDKNDFIYGDATKFESVEKQDLIICSGVFEHISDDNLVKNIIKKQLNNLSEDGKMVISGAVFHSYSKYANKFIKGMQNKMLSDLSGEQIKHRDPIEFENILKELGVNTKNYTTQIRNANSGHNAFEILIKK